jgi:hypothetical protein
VKRRECFLERFNEIFTVGVAYFDKFRISFFFLLALFLLVFHSLRQGIIMQHRLALNSRLSFLSLSSAGVR